MLAYKRNKLGSMSRKEVARRVAQFAALAPGVNVGMAALCDPSFLEMPIAEGAQKLADIVGKFPTEMSSLPEENSVTLESIAVLSGLASYSHNLSRPGSMAAEGQQWHEMTHEEQETRNSFGEVQFIAKCRRLQPNGRIWYGLSCISTERVSGTNLDNMHVCVQIPKESHIVHCIEIHAMARDQGGDRGGGGGTWGELAVGSTEKTREETAQVLSRRAAFVNTASGGEWQTHTLAFDPLQDSDPGQPLHSLLQPGMQVGLVLRSQFPGWCLHLKRASITLWYTSTYDSEAEQDLSSCVRGI